MPDDFVVARNPEPDSKLPYLLRIPLGEGFVLKARDSWPRTSKVYCHRVEEWPVDAEIVERVPTRSCVRRGSAIDLVLDRSRENRSHLVFTRIRGGRPAIFWQTARTNKQARPAVNIPTARGSGVADLQIVVDSHERYGYTFKDQRVVTRRAALPAGDYGVMLDDALMATVERKSLGDFVSSLTTGKLKYQLADLAAVPRAAVVVEAYRAARFSPAPPGTPDWKTTVRERDSTMPQGDVDTLHNDGKWHNVIEGTDQVSEPFDTLEEAVAEGREMARDLGVQHIVKNLDGTIAERNSYADDHR